MKTKTIIKKPNLKNALSILKGFDTFNLLYQAIDSRLNVQTKHEHRENLSIWIPICYRIGLVEQALKIANHSLCFFDKSAIDKLYGLYEKNNVEKLLRHLSEQILLDLSISGISIDKIHYRKKSLFSIIKKEVDLSVCNDLLGIELYLKYDDFFSEVVGNIITYLKNNYQVVKMIDFLFIDRFYKYIPLIDLILRDKNGNIFQLKIKCTDFESAEIGVNYFEYKEYNIDSTLLDDYQRISKILFLKNTYPKFIPEEMAIFLFEEIKTGDYFHKKIPEKFKSLSEGYINDINRHNQIIKGMML